MQAFGWGKASASEAFESTSAQNSPTKKGETTQQQTPIVPNTHTLPVLQHSLGLVSAAGFPQYSNYTPSFKNLLDYVFVQGGCMQTVRVAPFPSEETLCEHQGLPSCVFPSDHIAIAVDVKYT